KSSSTRALSRARVLVGVLSFFNSYSPAISGSLAFLAGALPFAAAAFFLLVVLAAFLGAAFSFLSAFSALAFFSAFGALAAFFFLPPLAARSAISANACSMVTDSGSVPSGRVALVSPSLT